jgi:hypothetical protein
MKVYQTILKKLDANMIRGHRPQIKDSEYVSAVGFLLVPTSLV